MADTGTSDKQKTEGVPPHGLNEAAVAQTRDDPDPGGAGDLTGSGGPSGGLLSGGGATMAGLTDDLIAAEAAALGPADGSLSDPEGGGPAGQHGGTGPAGAASPGGDSRR